MTPAEVVNNAWIMSATVLTVPNALGGLRFILHRRLLAHGDTLRYASILCVRKKISGAKKKVSYSMNSARMISAEVVNSAQMMSATVLDGLGGLGFISR
jgi:hypothetical protein